METLALTTHDERETRAIAARLAARLEPGDVVALDGPLGAGKTCFVRGLAAGLGIDEREVSSPTFVIWHEHRSPSGGPPLVHVDAYRLGGREELETIGLDEVIWGGEVILAVEWARRLGDALPEARVDVTLAHAGESIRALRIEGPARVVAGLGDVSSGASAPDPTGRCPICGDPVARAAPSFPFCSRRCRTVDLGRWLRGRYRI